MFKISLREVYRQIYGRKLSFTVTCKWNCKNVISDCISNDMPPQMKIWNYLNPHFNAFLQFCLNWRVASHIKPHLIQ